ncbi:MAG: hypothetical protein A2802_01935 [Candidatus Woykebacteria bacterium RIFCSPHIGHO2_01_FULL_43_29]|uniref:HEPN domain-containing protein n=2 Tax=Candidatus Woykeibacteriota TaxID=1817899 RepID=A0A1G1WVZ9_9BACT|nr:MAG: hypothetical protein A2802_01935 [Candidatus Woykebacteria bacterium RIFCSPHIGHO2_01_FULL_43_29]OGY30065.1 MAG: hypothetical protein A3J50_04195 [Candidatus Woykebacteria bacterium RIFCSPHIGHO2_02_FULL_43_16b]OGY31875.1 MAG: hypothetical protein A3A61_03110 [Candidatus Woykebacteria bacterium RIFCSPLOWO2_01_FULL_43_14]
MNVDEQTFLIKSVECLEGAGSEYANGRYNNCANRCYYACFQAAVYALASAGIRPTMQWGHGFVQAQFIGELINRQKRYPTDVRDVLERTYALRETADYEVGHVSNTQASRALRRARTFVTAIQVRGAERS